MDTNGRLKINTSRIVHETIDGETVILNLDTGNYYSLVGTGVQIWTFIESGAGVGDIVEKMKSDYAGGTGIEEAVREFISEICREGLAEPGGPDGGAAFQWPGGKGMSPENGDRQAFVPPVLNRYSDMQDLLLLDPIHDVDDDAGWPVAKPGPGGN